MAPHLSHLCLSFLFLIFSPSSARIPSQSPSPLLVPNYPETQFQKLIRGFNLFPESDISRGSPLGAAGPSPLMVEKTLQIPVLGDPGTWTSIKDFAHHAGYYRLPHTKDARMFYFFFESRKNKMGDPLVIWLTGGPGCSSSLALFYENGPYQVTSNLSLVWNDFGWDQASNIIFVDQPTGTGFSYSSSDDDIRHDEDGISNDLYDFLQEFFKNHPEYVKNDFFITGESYAGHYIPAFASRVNKGNKAHEGIFINLKGFAIGNGLTDPAFQYKAYPDYALEMKLINQSIYSAIVTQLIPPCEQDIQLCDAKGGSSCEDGFSTCNFIFSAIMAIAGDVNYYDIRKKCDGDLCYDFSNMTTFLNRQDVRDALGVGDIQFASCKGKVYRAMMGDWIKNLEVGIPTLLEEGIKLLVYAGEYDLICNWLGNVRWVYGMEWSGQKAFVAASAVPFSVDGEEKGLIQKHGPLTFLKVHDAGHMVPMDQPKAALEMLRRWTQGKLTETDPRDRLAPI